MPRPLRCDYPGALHHVINRGLGHRALFYGERDVRAFQALLAIQARWRRIEILVFSFLATHFHLLVRSLDGSLAGTMQWIGSMYGRYFNRTRARDGHVYRGRYLSRLVEDAVYLTNVITYIDFNAVKARISPTPEAHRLGSAAAYLGGRVPPWQATHTALSLAARLAPGLPGGAVDYRAIWRHAGVEEGANLAELAVQAPGVPLAPIGALVQSGPQGVQEWLLRSIALEDGSAARCLLLPPGHVVRALASPAAAELRSLPVPARQRLPIHKLLEVGLLVGVAGQTRLQAARFAGITEQETRTALSAFRTLLREAAQARHEMARVLHQALGSAYGQIAEMPTADLILERVQERGARRRARGRAEGT